MQVSEISQNKIKITLTDTEVLCCFNSYEKLYRMNGQTKFLLKAIVREIVEEKFSNKNSDKIIALIKIAKNKGLTIILTVDKVEKEYEYAFAFENFEDLLSALPYLLKRQYIIKNSQLFKLKKTYMLIISFRNKPIFLNSIKEFNCIYFDDEIKKEYIKEYGIPVIYENTVEKLVKSFIKDF